MKFNVYPFYRQLLLVAVAVSLLFSSCKEKTASKGLEVIFTSFDDEISLRDNLTFTFNHDILENDSLIGQWHTASYLKIDPAVPGKFQWLSPDQFVFSPAFPW